MSENRKIYEKAISEIVKGSSVALVTRFKTNKKANEDELKKMIIKETELDELNKKSDMNDNLKNSIKESLSTGRIQFIDGEENEKILIESIYPEHRIIIFGGGHISQPLVEFGARLGFSIILVDDRPYFANEGRFPNADIVICDSFENSFEQIAFNKMDYVILVTRGHRYDLACLKGLYKKDLAYLGMIGSKRRVKGIKDVLIDEGYKAEWLEKLYSPIGLNIGAITPEEIAISILGEVISVRRQGKDTIEWPEFDKDVYNELKDENSDYLVMATILSSKGSVPRKAGAKMLIAPDGRILGSIGGGCSESEVIQKARDIMLNGGYTIHHVDLTGDVAEDEGMVCGGIMEVLIEKL